MKKKFIFVVSLIACNVCLAQNRVNDTKLFKKNEIGVNLSDLAIARNIGVSYERIGYPLGFGITCRALLGHQDPDDSWRESYSITPFLRYYFFNNKGYNGYGFYGEGALKLFGGNYYQYVYNWNGEYPYDYYSSYCKETSVTDMAFCIGVGYKFINKYGFYLDINAGMGRAFGFSDVYPDEIVGRGGIIFGYRF